MARPYNEFDIVELDLPADGKLKNRAKLGILLCII